MDNLLQLEEDFWKIRARSNWLQLGDRNTKYFHHHASQRKRKNALTNLEDGKGQVIENQQKLETHMVNYFKELYAVDKDKGNLEAIYRGTEFRELSTWKVEELDKTFAKE